MIASRLRRHLPVGRKHDVRPAVARLVSARAFEATETQLDEIVRRAAALSASPLPETPSGDLLSDLAVGDWKLRAEAAFRLSSGGAWTPWSVVGSLAAAPADVPDDGHDDARLAAAALLAARETLSPKLADAQRELVGHAHGADAPRRRDAALRPLVSEFARNARAHGHGRQASSLRALAAAVHLKGRAMAGPSSSLPFLLGAAASTLLRPVRRAEQAPPLPMRLAQAVAAMNDVRAGMWGEDGASARLLGASAALAVFGRGSLAKPSRALMDRHHRAHLRHLVPLRLAHFTAAAAADALSDQAMDPRLDADGRRRLSCLADALRHHPAAQAVSCAEALEMDLPEGRRGEPRAGMRVWHAVMGRRRAWLHEGRNGRTVRCRAIASDDGAFVGYLAYDALSREFGRALHAVYALDGRRYGYAWADARPVVRRGEPEQGFFTAPERLQA